MQKCRDATHWIFGVVVLLVALAWPAAAHAATPVSDHPQAVTAATLAPSPADDDSQQAPADGSDVLFDEEEQDDDDDESSREGSPLGSGHALLALALRFDVCRVDGALAGTLTPHGSTLGNQFLSDSVRRM